MRIDVAQPTLRRCWTPHPQTRMIRTSHLPLPDLNAAMPTRRDTLQFAGSAAFASVLSRLAPRAARADDPLPPPVKVGQIGVGHAHASKISAFRESPDYEVVGIVEPSAELRQRAESQEQFRDLTWMTQEELLNTPGLQLVLVETEVKHSLAAAEACIAAGKHVHLDKPAGESLDHYERILADAERQGLLVQMGYMYRYNPGILLLREFLARGWLGEVFEIDTVMSKVVDPASRLALAEYPGGIMFELGCHIIDLVVGVLGRPDKVTPFIRKTSPIDDGLLDNMLAVFEYPSATATVRTTALEVEGFARRHFTVCGSEGTFHIQPLDSPSARIALSVEREGYTSGYQEVTFPPFVRYVADAADMALVIRGEKESDYSYGHDWAVQASLLAACGL
jgi:predicted dehydrogenase